MFATAKKRHKSRKFPEIITLSQVELPEPAPQWEKPQPPTFGGGDIVQNRITNKLYQVRSRLGRKSGGERRLFLKLSPPGQNQPITEALEEDCEYATEDPLTGAELQEIRYLYPDPIKKTAFGCVVRRQWSDRRPWMEDGRKTKEVRPWHWEGSEESGQWVMGRGDRPWPLYREDEAQEAILKGQVVFAVAGEQAVEVYRSLGLVATTCAGGEAHWESISSRLEDAFAAANRNGEKPILVVHPDFDLTGENIFGQQLVKDCTDRDIPVVCMNPQDIWGNIPHGGDIKEVVEESGMDTASIIKALEYAIDEAIDRQDKEERLVRQRYRWNAPDTYQGELGYWKDSETNVHSSFTPLTNFDFQIEKEVASPDGGGFVLQLKRAGEYQQYRVFLPSMEFTSVAGFENTLKKALGGALICRLTTNQMKALLRVRLHEYTHNRGGRVYKLCQRVGQQPDSFWVFPRMQLKPTGEITDENKSLWIWNTGLTGDESTLPKPAISPPDDQALTRLVEAMTQFYGPTNIFPGLMALGYGAASVHYQQIMEESGAFPILNLIGDAGSGKTVSAICALSLVGMHTEAAGGMLRDVSISAAYEHLKITGSLLHCLDDPARTPELDEFLKGLYNGKARLVRGQNGAAFNMQRPHSPLMVTSNFACGETNTATMSRLLQLWSDNRESYDKDRWDNLEAAMRQASGALPSLIKLGYPREAIAATEKELMQHLPQAHSRISSSLALIVWYTEAVCRLARVDRRFDVRRYAIETVCSMANDVDNSADSLRDFVEKLFILRSQAKVGDWNMRFINEHNSDQIKALALNLPSIWNTLDSNFKLPYNLRIIKHLLTGRGANMEGRQKFHMDEDVSRAFQRGSTSDPRWQIKRCVEVPISIIRKYLDGEETMSTESTDPLEPPEALATSEDSQLTSKCQLNVNWEENMSTENEEASQLTESQLSTERSVDKNMSTDQTHTGSGFEPSQEAQLTQLTKKMDADVIATPGTKVRILAGRFMSLIAYVVGPSGDKIEVERPTWQINRKYLPGDLEVVHE
jgi:hypothetical protein